MQNKYKKGVFYCMKCNCIICGQEFEAQKSTAKYCSNNCRNAMRRQKYAKKEKIPKDINYKGENKICPICGEIFTPKTSLANQRICCYNCMPDGIQLTRGAFQLN